MPRKSKDTVASLRKRILLLVEDVKILRRGMEMSNDRGKALERRRDADDLNGQSGRRTST